jgi:hypothetical protein
VETATQALHRLTSYRPGREWTDPVDDPRVLQNLEVNDPARFPWFYKRYPESLPRVQLPRELPPTNVPAVAVLAGTAEVTRAEVDLPQLSRLLHLSAGVVRTATRNDGRIFLFRAAGSAGGRFPLEVYLVVPEGTRLPAGVHWYDPEGHALVQVGPAPRGGVPALVVTGIPWRTGWRYRERGYRHIYWDAGTMLAQLLAAADSAGVIAELYTRFPDRTVTELVGADGMHEWPVAVVGLGVGAPALGASGPAAAGDVDADPLEFPLDTAAQRAGECAALGSPWDRGVPVDVPVEGADPATRQADCHGCSEPALTTQGNQSALLPVESVVLARGSQRRMDPTRGLPKSLLDTCLPAALRGIDLPHYVAVHDVEGLAPGIYRWPDLAAPVHAGDLRAELYRVTLDQSLTRDAAFVVITAADVATLDDREYREAQLAAGVVEGRLHLLAYALGASATGMTFLDSEIPGLLGEPLDALLFTCVGVPDYASTAGGQPGAPAAIRTVQPRD